MESQAGFYQLHLNRVSRSFAFCIEQLSSPLREWVGLSYLLFRILDTVEDALWEDWSQQDRNFETLHAFLEAMPSREELRSWVDHFPGSLPEGEKLLLEDSFRMLSDFHSLPEAVREPMRLSVAKMNRGMSHFSHMRRGSELRLRTLKEVNQYCFCVAGLVGELLGELFEAYDPRFSAPAGFYRNSFQFGLFLQKVNLLKDQRGDEREGRYLVPDRKLVLQSLLEHSRGAFDYLLSLPPGETGYRLFCAWSLFIGMASLPWSEEAYSRKEELKIPRAFTLELTAHLRSIITDEAELRAMFEESLGSLEALGVDISRVLASRGANASVGVASQDSWFVDLASSAHLSSEGMVELGLL